MIKTIKNEFKLKRKYFMVIFIVMNRMKQIINKTTFLTSISIDLKEFFFHPIIIFSHLKRHIFFHI